MSSRSPGELARVVVRPPGPGDEMRIGAMLSRCSAATLHRRFLAPVPAPSAGDAEASATLVRNMIGVRVEGDLTLVAVRGQDVVGVAELRRRLGDLRHADIALLVEDGCQQRGIGAELIRLLALAARDDGIHELTGDSFGDNQPASRAFRRAGLRPQATTSSGLSRIRVSLASPATPEAGG